MVNGDCNSDVPEPARFYGLTAWNNEKGAECVNCGSVQWLDFFMVHNEKAGIEMKLIVTGKEFDPDGFIIGDARIQSDLPSVYSGE